MKIHAVIHAPAEGLGSIADWARSRGHTVRETHLYRGETLPPIAEVDFAVMMGGAMNIYQHRDFPWLVTEKRWIAEAIGQRKRVLGVCLGAQLIADVLGGKVVQNPEREIGWFQVRMLTRSAPFAAFPGRLHAFHWHGDTFELPPGAVRIARSEGCANQGFVVGDRVVGLQFHLEVTPESVGGFIAGAEEEIGSGRFVQSAETIRRGLPDFDSAALASMLDALASPAD